MCCKNFKVGMFVNKIKIANMPKRRNYTGVHSVDSAKIVD